MNIIFLIQFLTSFVHPWQLFKTSNRQFTPPKKLKNYLGIIIYSHFSGDTLPILDKIRMYKEKNFI